MTDELLEEELEQLNHDGVGLPPRIQAKLRRSHVTRRNTRKLDSAERNVSSPHLHRKQERDSKTFGRRDEEV